MYCRSIDRSIGEWSNCIDATTKHRGISLYYSIYFDIWSPCDVVCDTISEQAHQVAHVCVHRLNKASMNATSACVSRRMSSFSLATSSTAITVLADWADFPPNACFCRVTWLKVAQLGGNICPIWQHWRLILTAKMIPRIFSPFSETNQRYGSISDSTDKSHVVCKKCNYEIRYGDTTNMSGHLKKKHGIDLHEASGNVNVSDGSGF